MNRLIDCLAFVLAILACAIILLFFASFGEPQSSWIICDIMGFESVCQ